MSRLIENAKHNLDYLRNQRAKLFKAFDIYKQNVSYGLIIESGETHAALSEWYLNCLNLEYDSISNPPEEILRYLK